MTARPPSEKVASSLQNGHTESLTSELSSLRRVRNRLSSTPDQRLPQILVNLIPRLFGRLEAYDVDTVAEGSNSSNNSQKSDSLTGSENRILYNVLRRKNENRNEIFGILSSALDRLKGSPTIEQFQLVASFIPSISPFLSSHHNVVSAWSVSFLNVAIQRQPGNTLNPVRPLPSPPQVDWPSFLRCQIIALERCHSNLSQIRSRDDDSADNGDSVDTNSSVTKALEVQYSRISWLILDTIFYLSGYLPFVDFEKYEFEPRMLHHRNLLDDTPTRHAISQNISELFNAAHGIAYGPVLVSLVLDVLLFIPDGVDLSVSEFGIQQMTWRGKMKHDDNDDDMLNLRNDLPLRFRRRRQLPNSRSQWSENYKVYLRYLKMNVVKWLLWPVEFALFQSNELDQSHRSSTKIDDRAMFVALLTSNSESMHGRIAMDFIKKYRSTTEFRLSKTRQSTNLPISLCLVCAILISTTGEKDSAKLLDEFEETNGEGCWRRILGRIRRSSQIHRPAMSYNTAHCAFQLLFDTSIEWTGEEAVDEAYTLLLIRIIDQKIQQVDKTSKNLYVRLLCWIYHQIKVPSPTVYSYVFDAIVGVLQTVVQVGEAERDELLIEGRGERPGGVPIDFGRRADLGRLLSSHRSLMRRKMLSTDDALATRKEVYNLIQILAPFMLTWETKKDKSFIIPRQLLFVLGHEDTRLQPFARKALDSLLEVYKERPTNSTVISSDAVISLLPAIVEAMLSNDETTRQTAMVWISQLLVRSDVEASLYICSRFEDDTDRRVAQIAHDVLSKYSCRIDEPMSDPLSVKFLPIVNKDKEGGEVIQNDLDSKTRRLADDLPFFSVDECTVIMIDNSFSNQKAIERYESNSDEVRRLCGLMKPSIDDEDWDIDNDLVCGICYDSDQMSLQGSFRLNCNHIFCLPCWSSYISQSTNRSLLDLRCPQHNCNQRVTPLHIQQVAPNDYSRWKSTVLTAYVESQENLQQCPGCDFVAVNEGQGQRIGQVSCTNCNKDFCFECREPQHEPASCQDMKQWLVEMAKSSISKKLSSKPCPGCNAFIEKNGGCNHMKCTSCGCDFCWICLETLDTHLQQHQCTPYNPSQAADDDYEKHVLFTASRHQAHEEARRFASSQSRSFVGEKLIESFWFLDEKDDPELIHFALSTIVRSRTFLMNSYIALFGFRQRDDQKGMKQYELHHGCLEMFTERLSQLVEINMQRLFLEQGQYGVLDHFKKIDFYTGTVIKYMERIEKKMDCRVSIG